MPRLLQFLLPLWAFFFVAGILTFLLIQPNDSGFTRGLNRAGPMLLLEGVALILAIAAIVVAIRGRAELSGGGWALALAPLPTMILALVLRILAVNNG